MKLFDGRINGRKSFKLISILIIYFCQQMYYSTTTTKISATIPSGMQSMDALENEQTIYPGLQTTVGSSVGIPCNITLTSSSDAVKLILWYKGSDFSGSPIYSIDARNTPLKSAQHFISNSIESRAKADLSVRPALLRIDSIIDSDDGQYWCRVDFRWTRTSISVVTLTVIVPPISLLLKDMNGIVVNNTITVNENEDLRLVCEGYGGKPLPSVKWFLNLTMIDDNYSIKTNQNITIVENELILKRLTRNQLLSSLKCLSSNSNLTQSISQTITIDINLMPLSVKILPPFGIYLLSGVKTEVICRTFGSKPAAIVSWFINDHNVTHLSETINEKNFTQSVLEFTPHWSHNSQQLICRAENPRLPNRKPIIQEAIVLDIRYIPLMSLTFGNSNKTAFRFSEGSEIVLNCSIRANPNVSVVRWTHNSQEIWHQTNGIITSNTTLIIKSANRQHEGRYQCVAFNAEGRGVSNDVRITIDYSPICVTEAQSYSVRIGDTVNLTCELDAQPDNLTFFWTVNNIVNSDMKINYFWLKSWASYQPLTVSDFGVVRCWARNDAGFQSIPCVFNVSMSNTVLPNKVNNCSINTTTSSISIECNAGFEGRTSQSYHLEVYDSRRKVLLRNMTSTLSPSFIAHNLTAGATYVLIVTASNSKGRSSDLTLIAKTVSAKISIEVPLSDSEVPVILILISICASLIILIIIVFVVSKVKSFKKNSINKISAYKSNEPQSLKQLEDDSVQNPDVIPDNPKLVDHYNTNRLLICNGNALPIRERPMNYSNKNILCNSSAQIKREFQNHVKFLTPDETNKIFSEESPKNDNFLAIECQELVVATIENHPFTQKYLSSYSTPV